MCRPIRELSEARGYDPAQHVLACFGGAGAQHVCAIARALGMRTAVVHAYAGILSAYGMGLADTVVERQAPCAEQYGLDGVAERIQAKLGGLERAATAELASQGVTAARMQATRYLNLRYAGTDNAIMVREPADGDYGRRWRRPSPRVRLRARGGRPLLIDDARVRVVGEPAVLARRPIRGRRRGRRAAGSRRDVPGLL